SPIIGAGRVFEPPFASTKRLTSLPSNLSVSVAIKKVGLGLKRRLQCTAIEITRDPFQHPTLPTDIADYCMAFIHCCEQITLGNANPYPKAGIGNHKLTLADSSFYRRPPFHRFRLLINFLGRLDL